MYVSCPGFPSGGHKNTAVKHKHMLFPPAESSPLMTEDLLGMPRSWCLLSITGLAALGLAKRYGTPSEASIIGQISPCWIIFLQLARRASVLVRFSSLQSHWYGHRGSDLFSFVGIFYPPLLWSELSRGRIQLPRSYSQRRD
jgi:hypothetical protein